MQGVGDGGPQRPHIPKQRRARTVEAQPGAGRSCKILARSARIAEDNVKRAGPLLEKALELSEVHRADVAEVDGIRKAIENDLPARRICLGEGEANDGVPSLLNGCRTTQDARTETDDEDS